MCIHLLNSQDLAACGQGYFIDLSVGYELGGYGSKECGCSDTTNYCELLHIIMRRSTTDGIELIECPEISLTERWWREKIDYVDLYDPLTCEEYPESNTHTDRYEIRTDHLKGGDTLSILVCKTDPFNQNLMEFSATPGAQCSTTLCPPILDCPVTFKLRKNLECEYLVPDFTLGVTLIDSCQTPPIDVTEDYVLMQSPTPGSIITDSIFVQISVFDAEGALINTCDVYVTLAGDPPPEINTPDAIADITYGDPLPNFQELIAWDTLPDNSVIQVWVATSIDEYTIRPCDGYTMTYRWTARDTCGNESSQSMSFQVLPDDQEPVFVSVPADIDTILVGDPLPIFVDLTAVNKDGTATGITMIKEVLPYSQNLCMGYPVSYQWTATDQCNNTAKITKVFYVKPINAPPLFIEQPTQIEDIYYSDPLPSPQTLQATTANGSQIGVTVEHHVEPYVEDPCNPYPVTYIWTARDTCNNSAQVSMQFMVHPDTIDLNTMLVMEDISLAIVDQCNQSIALTLPFDIRDYNVLTASISIRDDRWDTIAQMPYQDDISYSFGQGTSYVIYTLIQRCGVVIMDTIAVHAADVQAPILVCPQDITLYVDNSSLCTVNAAWSIPEAFDNCGVLSIRQMEGPAAHSEISTGRYNIVYEASDNQGNTAVCQFSLTVAPVHPDEFLCQVVTIELDAQCEAWIDTEVLAQNNSLACISDLETVIIVGLDTLSESKINLGLYRDQVLYYRICDPISGLCCQNQIEIKDTQAPIIICDGDVYMPCYNALDDYRPQLASECSSVIWRYSDQVQVDDCTYPTTQQTITRTFVAIDEYGNESQSCAQNIIVQFAQINQQLDRSVLVFPSDTVIPCHLYDFDKQQSSSVGFPTINGHTLYPNYGGVSICNIEVSYQDDVIVSDGCTKLVIRTWTIIEPKCQYDFELITHRQIIKIIDVTPPQFFLDQQVIRLETNTKECNANYSFSSLSAYDDCQSSESLTYKILWRNDLYSPSEIIELPYGIHKLVVQAIDDCNNIGTDTITVEVIDPIIPVAICYENIVVPLSGKEVKFYASSLDAGSHDNCFVANIEVRRTQSYCTPLDTFFGDFVKFCCEDIGDLIRVDLKVTDYVGNINYCSAIIGVTDKSAPILTIPPDLTVDCQLGIVKADGSDPYGHLFGTPQRNESISLTLPEEYVLSSSSSFMSGSIIGECSEEVELLIETKEQISDCGTGQIQRTFTAIDISGNPSNSLTQTILIVGGNTLDTSLIHWPVLRPATIECMDIQDIDPNTLGQPSVPQEGCSLIGITYEDRYYQLIGDTNGACSKMTRQWTVIDWCNPQVKVEATRTQTFKIVDGIEPVISTCDNTAEPRVVFASSDDCQTAEVLLVKEATDNCISVAQLIWSLDIDIDADAILDERIANLSIDSNGLAFVIKRLPLGRHRLEWTVRDQCGNESRCSEYIVLENNKPPTPYAQGLSTTLASDGTVEIWASDLHLKSEHPCYQDLKTSIGFSNEAFETSSDVLEFNCDHLGSNAINVYAYRTLVDGTIAYDYATVNVEIQDNYTYCTYIQNGDESPLGLSGSVLTPSGVILQEANLILYDIESEITDTTTIDNEGQYAFASTKRGRSYQINVQYEDLVNNGLSTRDVILIQQHLMGIDPFESHWDMILADVNHDQSVSAIDIVELRKAILLKESLLDQYPPWRFLSGDLVFDPVDFETTDLVSDDILITSMVTSLRKDLVALKVGDIDQSAILSYEWASTRSYKQHQLIIRDQILQEGQVGTFYISIEHINTYGWQWAINLDKRMEILEVTSPFANLGIIDISGNKISTSLSQSTFLDMGNEPSHIMKIRFRARGNIRLSQTITLSHLVEPEIYDEHLDTRSLQLSFVNDETTYEVSDISPNPFGQSSALISLMSPHETEGSLSIVDISGRLVVTKKIKIMTGHNNIEISEADITTSGTYFIQLDINQRRYHFKLIHI